MFATTSKSGSEARQIAGWPTSADSSRKVRIFQSSSTKCLSNYTSVIGFRVPLHVNQNTEAEAALREAKRVLEADPDNGWRIVWPNGLPDSKLRCARGTAPPRNKGVRKRKPADGEPGRLRPAAREPLQPPISTTSVWQLGWRLVRRQARGERGTSTGGAAAAARASPPRSGGLSGRLLWLPHTAKRGEGAPKA